MTSNDTHDLNPSKAEKSTQPVTFQVPDRVLELVEERVAEVEDPSASEVRDIIDEYLTIEPRYLTQEGADAVDAVLNT